MTIRQLERLYLFYFQIGCFEKIKLLDKKYSYFEKTNDMKIISLTSDFFKTGDLKILDEIKNQKETDYFYDLMIFSEFIKIKFNKLDGSNEYDSKGLTGFIYPHIYSFSINSNSFDLSYKTIIEENITNSEIVLKFLQKITKITTRYQMMLEFAIANLEFQKGYETAMKMLDLAPKTFELKDWASELKDFICIVNFFRFYEQIQKDFYNTEDYKKLLNLFKNTPVELNVLSIGIFKEKKEKILELYNECINRLSRIYEKDDYESNKNLFLDLFKRKLNTIK